MEALGDYEFLSSFFPFPLCLELVIFTVRSLRGCVKRIQKG